MPKPKIKVACCGDSITFGHGIKDKDRHSYPNQLQGLLGYKYEVQNFGTNHATVFKKGSKPYWNMRSYEKAKAFSPDIVVLMLGANCSNKTNWKNEKNFISDYIELIQSFQELPSTPKVFVCLPPPAIKLKFGINPTIIKEFQVPRLQEMISKQNLKSINIHSRLDGQEDCFSDFVHPNEKGAELIAKEVYKSIV